MANADWSCEVLQSILLLEITDLQAFVVVVLCGILSCIIMYGPMVFKAFWVIFCADEVVDQE